MIAQLLNRQFLLDQFVDVEQELQRLATLAVRREALPRAAHELSPDDLASALKQLRLALEREHAASSGQQGFELPASDRRGHGPPDLDDVSFLSRDPVLSNVQSALDEYFVSQEPEAVEETSASGRRLVASEVPVTTQMLKGATERPAPLGRRLFNKFSVTDIGWVSTIVAEAITKFRKKYPFNPVPATPRTIAERVRIVLVGDWGTGLCRARKVANEIRNVIRAGEREGIEQHVIHLGDVYYSGWQQEYQRRFLPYWPVRVEQGDRSLSWCLNGNHDMYSGGHAYFETLLKDPRFRGHEGSSFFSLSNKSWRILGLDTAWEDGSLKDPQPEWVRRQAEEARQLGQRVMLLSHHQLFSVFENGANRLATTLGDVLATGLIHSWIWGHEHRCVAYGPHQNLRFSCCLGHGGVPVYMTHRVKDKLPEPATYEYRDRIKSGLESWALFGFAVLDFANAVISIRLINENGHEHYSTQVS